MLQWIKNMFVNEDIPNEAEPSEDKSIEAEPICSIQEQVKDLLHQHHDMALNSPYDHKVSIMAMGAVRSTVERIDVTLPDTAYLTQLEEDLIHCRDTYNNSGGQYTSGKAEIGSFLSAIQELQLEL